MMEWLNNNWIEVVGAILAIIYLFLEVKQNWTMWLIGIVSSAFYIYIFFGAKLYAEMGLNVYYVVMSFYGLYAWKLAKTKENDKLILRHISGKVAILSSVLVLVTFGLLVYILKNYTDSPVPIADAIVASCSIVATWLVTRKIVECWYLWIFTNFFAIGLYLYQGLYPTSVLYVFYGVMSVIGLLEWRKSAKLAREVKEKNHNLTV